MNMEKMKPITWVAIVESRVGELMRGVTNTEVVVKAMVDISDMAESNMMRMLMGQCNITIDLVKEREQIPRPHEEPRHWRNRNHERNKMYKWPIKEEVPSRERKGPLFRHGGSDTSQSCILPRKTNLSHPIRSP